MEPEEVAADDPTLEEEIDLEDVIEDDDDDLPGDLEDEESEGESKEEGPEEGTATVLKKLKDLEERNINLQGWAARMRHENRDLGQELARQRLLTERSGRLLEAIAQQSGVDLEELETPPEERIPDEDEDFAGHIAARVRKEFREEIAGLKEEQGKQQQQQQLETRVQQVHRYHDEDTSRFEAEHPDYQEAETYLTEATFLDQAAAIHDRYPRMSAEDVERHAWAATAEIVANHQIQFAMEGQSLAAYVYQRAQERGWQPGQESAAQNGQPKGKRSASGAEDLKRRRRRSGTSLASVSGSAGVSGGNLESLADMSDEEFADTLESMEKGGKSWESVAKKLLGA